MSTSETDDAATGVDRTMTDASKALEVATATLQELIMQMNNTLSAAKAIAVTTAAATSAAASAAAAAATAAAAAATAASDQNEQVRMIIASMRSRPNVDLP